MSSPGGETACRECLLHAWLLEQLTGPLDRQARNPDRLLAALALDSDGLLGALAGRRRAELGDSLARLRAEAEPAPHGGTRSTCRHRSTWPLALRRNGAPRALFVEGASDVVLGGAHPPVVAVTGSVRATEQGERTAQALARGLAASGVLVAALDRAGIAASALAGAARSGLPGVLIACSGLGQGRWQQHPARPQGGPLVLAELAPRTAGRSFGPIAAQRTLVLLASVVVVVEARASAPELLCARAARSAGTRLAAVPGRVGSPDAEVPNALIRGGASLVRGAEDVLALLGGGIAAVASGDPGAPKPIALSDAQRAVLARVDRGIDTPAQLATSLPATDAALNALSELELLGVLRREGGGRYRRAAALSGRERELLDERLSIPLGSLKQSAAIDDIP